ncbi:MAG: conjugal transfer protein TraX [Oscillospiraceae bacterium]|nr:conjugal transfer protein TraX [Oscillospiraceae bacterium]
MLTEQISETKDNGLDRVGIKYIAIAAMLIDHIALFFVPHGDDSPFLMSALYFIMRFIGRITGPVMIFFLTEGFTHTSSKKKYGIRLLLFGLISQIPYALSHYDKLLVLDFNVIITLAMIFLMLLASERISDHTLNTVAVFAIIMITFCCDWGVFGPFMAWLFYRYRDDRKMQLRMYSTLCTIQVVSAAVFLAKNGCHWYGELWQTGVFLVVPILNIYNGKRGSGSAVNKWIFYIIYPLHLLIIWLIKYKIR